MCLLIGEQSILQESVEPFGSIAMAHYRPATKKVLHRGHLPILDSQH